MEYSLKTLIKNVISNISDRSYISHSSSSLTNPALALALTATHPLLHSCPSRFQILPAFEVEDQCSNDDKDEEKNEDDADEDNDTRADACLIVGFLLCFATDLCPALAKAERTRDRLVFDDHVSENGDDD